VRRGQAERFLAAASQAQGRPVAPRLDKPLNGDAPQRASSALDRRAATALDARRSGPLAAPTTAAGLSPDAVDALFAVRRATDAARRTYSIEVTLWRRLSDGRRPHHPPPAGDDGL